jgi:hypothetical protein
MNQDPEVADKYALQRASFDNDAVNRYGRRAANTDDSERVSCNEILSKGFHVALSMSPRQRLILPALN